jgi:hypothetical protein
MNTTSKITKKRVYTQPEVEYIVMDNEISLQLASAPLAPPNDPEANLMTPGFVNQNPFKDQLA